MATKNSKTTKTTQEAPKKNSFAENYGSTILGFIVVLILGSFLFNVFRGNTKNGSVGSGEETQNQEEQVAGRTHTVVAGDDLWKISEKYFNTGYNWTDIAKANNITNANQIEIGQKLVIPDVSPAAPTEMAQAPETTVTVAPTATSAPTVKPTEEIKATPTATVTSAPQQAETTPTSGSYTVQKGDSLWSIAVAQYNDGYKWVEIARANKLVHPNVIHTGNVLTLPR